jgi:hypothetical protein
MFDQEVVVRPVFYNICVVCQASVRSPGCHRMLRYWDPTEAFLIPVCTLLLRSDAHILPSSARNEMVSKLKWWEADMNWCSVAECRSIPGVVESVRHFRGWWSKSDALLEEWEQRIPLPAGPYPSCLLVIIVILKSVPTVVVETRPSIKEHAINSTASADNLPSNDECSVVV